MWGQKKKRGRVRAAKRMMKKTALGGSQSIGEKASMVLRITEMDQFI
jgi:hypothetical protein